MEEKISASWAIVTILLLLLIGSGCSQASSQSENHQLSFSRGDPTSERTYELDTTPSPENRARVTISSSEENGCPRSSKSHPCTNCYDTGQSLNTVQTSENKHGLGWLKEKEGTAKAPRAKPQTALALPSSLDWRSKSGVNWITPIRDQGDCGSCVAFGTVAAVEAAFRIRSGDSGWDINLSEQHLFSCGGGSCPFGWWTGSALDYLMDDGTPLESCMPYQAWDVPCSKTCPDWQSEAYRINGWNWVADDVASIEASLQYGPVVGAMDVYDDFFSYSGGIYRHTYGKLAGGHCIAIVGYDSTQGYWICKNSWGDWWGEDGFFRIAFGECSINKYVAAISAPTLYQVTFASNNIGTDSSGTVLTVNGVAFTQDELPYNALYSPALTITYNFAAVIPATTGKQYVWTSTTGMGQSARTGVFSVTSGGTITGTYKIQNQLSILVSPLGGGSTSLPTGFYWYDSGSSVTVTATPASGFEFHHWNLDGSNVSSSLSYLIGMSSTHILTAFFATQRIITCPSSSLAQNPLGRIFLIFNNKKYYVINSAAFNSYVLNWADVQLPTILNPDNYQGSQIYHDYLLDGKMPLPNQPYIAGDVDDGSLYYVPYYSWSGEKYPINGSGYDGYGGFLKTLLIRYGDPAMSLSTSLTVLEGANPIPSVTPPSYVLGKNALGRVFFIFNNQKYYFTNWPNYLSYGFTSVNITSSINPDSYPNAQVSLDYLLEDASSVFRKPLPNQPYIVGDVNDGSLYWVPYYTWSEEKYPITGTGYNAYGGQLRTMPTRYGDPSINLPTSTYILDGVHSIPTITQQ